MLRLSAWAVLCYRDVDTGMQASMRGRGTVDGGRSIQNTTVLERCDTRSTSRDIRVGVQVFFRFPAQATIEEAF